MPYCLVFHRYIWGKEQNQEGKKRGSKTNNGDWRTQHHFFPFFFFFAGQHHTRGRASGWRNRVRRPCTEEKMQVILRHQIIHFPTSSGVSERASDWMSTAEHAVRAVRSKQMSERCDCERMSKQKSEWPISYVPILGCSEPLCHGARMALLLFDLLSSFTFFFLWPVFRCVLASL